jgi:hypothetical protein
MKLTHWLVCALGIGVLSCATDSGVLDGSGTAGRDKGADDDDGDDRDDDDDKVGSSGTTTKRDGGTRSTTKRDGGKDDACESLTVSAQPNAPEILIVLDRSGSMVGLGSTRNAGRNRWVPSMNAVQAVTQQLGETVAFGLMTFPSRPTGPTGGVGGIFGGGGALVDTCLPGKIDVPVAVNSAAMIRTTLQSATPDIGATPTTASLEAALTALDKSCVVDCANAPRYVLLVTDGQPTCGSGGTGETTPEDIAATVAAIDKLAEADIKTYVVGYDTQSDPQAAGAMDQFAMHGGTEKHYPVENEQTLVAELTRIAGALVTCEYELSSDIENPEYVRVTIDGEQQNLSQGHWRIDGRKIILEGACDKLKDAKPHDLRITKECAPVSVI